MPFVSIALAFALRCLRPHSHTCYPHAMRKHLALAFTLFLTLALFPYGWLARLWPPFGLFVDWLFATEMAHHIGHSLIFVTLGWFLLTVFPTLRGRFPLYLSLIGFLGLSQELLQLWYKQRPLGVNDGKDLLVDVAAATLFFFTYQQWHKRIHATPQPQPYRQS